MEHLALFPLSLDRPDRVNGAVNALSTQLFTVGRPEQVADFLAGAGRSLHDLVWWSLLLTGRPPVPADLEQISAEAVTELAEQARAAALYRVPERFPLARAGIHRVRGQSARELTGTLHRPVSQASWNAPFRLVRADDGLAFEDTREASQGQVVVLSRDCAAVLHGQHDARTLIGNDGFRLELRPQEWPRGRELVEHASTGPSRPRCGCCCRNRPSAVRRPTSGAGRRSPWRTGWCSWPGWSPGPGLGRLGDLLGPVRAAGRRLLPWRRH